MALKLQVSATVIYNIETGRTRIEIAQFFRYLDAAKIEWISLFQNHMHSIQGLPSRDPSIIVRAFRKRLETSQASLARALGYKSSSMVHHFEKGIRNPSLRDLFALMELAGDNIRGLVQNMIGDQVFASNFPAGQQPVSAVWQQYWEHHYISAMRQIMRTTTYKEMKRYNPGLFSDLLNISMQEERRGLEILKELGLLYWEKAKPCINASAKILIPKGISKLQLDQFKASWVKFGMEKYKQNSNAHDVVSVDILPISQELFQEIVLRIRSLQDEIHNMQQSQTDGFTVLCWMATHCPIS